MARAQLLQRRLERRADGGGAGHGGEEGDDRVVAALPHHDLQIAGEQVHPVEGLGGDVDRIARRAEREAGEQLGLRRLRHGRQLEAVIGGDVGHQDAATAGDRHDAEALPGRQDAAGRGISEIDGLLRRFRPPGAEIAKDRVVDGVAAGQRRRVARGSRRADRRAPDLDGDDRLAGAPRLLQRFEQSAAVACAFEIEDDDLRLGIINDSGQALRCLHVGLVAGGDPIAQAEAALAGEIIEVRAEGAALADDRQRAGRRQGAVERVGKASVEAGMGGEEAEAVRAEDAHAARARNLCQLHFGGPARSAGLREAGGEDDAGLHPLGGAVAHGLHGQLGGKRDDCRLHIPGDGGNLRKCGQPLHLGPVRVHGHDAAGEAAFDQIAQRAAADARRILRGADDRDRARLQQRTQRRGGLGCHVPFRGASLSRGSRCARRASLRPCGPNRAASGGASRGRAGRRRPARSRRA